MILWDILYALFLGLFFTAIYIIGFGRERGWSGIFAALFLIFLAVWSGGKWTSQLYLYTHGVYGLPMLVLGLVVILILTALIPSRLENASNTTTSEKRHQKGQIHHLRFWAVSVFFIVTIIIWYIIFSQNTRWNPQYYNGPDTLKSLKP